MKGSRKILCSGCHLRNGMNAVTICDRITNKRNSAVTPYAFTEQGMAMLSGVLNSHKAISMNIVIMRAFVEIRKSVLKQLDFKEQLTAIKDRLGEHDVQLSQIYDAMENMPDEKILKVPK